ncbi:MAG: GTPase, partial [Rhodospirillales bacterium]
WLRLKLIADVGLVGLPNAGKSTYLAAVSRAKPKIADYPFTTLHPNLGVVVLGNDSFVIADVPGLIEGASDGAGLGTRFLGHIERCRALLHLIDGTEEDVVGAYQTIRHELAAYGGQVAAKTEIVALNKCDALTPEVIEEKRAQLADVINGELVLMSAVAGTGVQGLLGQLLILVQQGQKDSKNEEPETV